MAKNENLWLQLSVYHWNSSLPCPLRLYMGSIDWIAFFLFQFFEEKSRQFIMVEFTIRSGGGE
jgi:hypothetical protein